MKPQREYWIDAIKILACALVVLGHFFQSVVTAGIIPDNQLYQSFNQSIYSFHVPLFFICSGYLYQKYSHVASFSAWKSNVLKKLCALGIPYVVFSTVTWGLKTVFSGHTNSAIDAGLLDTLLLKPLSPYWYLYCLFFIFLITPTFANRKTAGGFMLAALALKLLSVHHASGIYAVSTVCSNAIWFILGMYLCLADIRRLFCRKLSSLASTGCMVILLGYTIFITREWNAYENFIIGFFACAGIVLLSGSLFHQTEKSGFLKLASRYTMPIFLLHTLFAAPWRIVLMKAGISSPAVHIVTGILISFIGPVVAAEIMGRFRFLDILLYPLKYIRLDGSKTV
ncbi:MAG: acyltransferase [Clostridia bacterium]|nr:acyltransferase [Clostridia bacterium]